LTVFKINFVAHSIIGIRKGAPCGVEPLSFKLGLRACLLFQDYGPTVFDFFRDIQLGAHIERRNAFRRSYGVENV
jgi:hypothetical protein